jgi:tetrapyrrole methylase family protein/MazG family protein
MKKYAHVKKLPEDEADWFQVLLDLARFLRSPEGCPWDRKQTSKSFAAFVQEEAGELSEAFGEDDASVAEEWGDTLFTLLASAAAAEMEGRFKVRDALEKAHEKMIRRHGHIFGEHQAETPEEVVEVWNKIKAKEKEEKKKKKDE